MKTEVEALLTMSPDQLLKRMLRYFRGKNPHRRELAVLFFKNCGRAAQQWLAGELVAKGRKDPYQLAVLDVLERIGLPLEPRDFYTVMMAIRFEPAVGRRVMQVLTKLRQADRDTPPSRVTPPAPSAWPTGISAPAPAATT